MSPAQPGPCCTSDNYWEHISNQETVKLSKTDNELIRQVFDQAGISYHPDTMLKDTGQLADAIMDGMGKQAFQYGTDDNLLYTAMELNLNRFGFNKNLAQISELNQALQSCNTFAEFKESASGIVGNYKLHHLRTEYNLAVASAQNGRAWVEMKQEAELFPYWQYETAGDDKVRASHAALDGKVFALSDKQAMALYPPNGHGCRCGALQVDKEEAAELGVTPGSDGAGILGEEWDRMTKQGFDKNVGETGDIFDLSKTYAKQLEGVRNEISKLTYKDAGLPDISLLQKGKRAIHRKKTTGADVLKGFNRQAVEVNGRKVKVYKDYSGRPVGLEQQLAARHLEQKYDEAIFHNLQKAMATPDEVYLQQVGEQFRYRYVKAYKDQVLTVDAYVNKELGLDIQNWGLATGEQESWRTGLIVKK